MNTKKLAKKQRKTARKNARKVKSRTGIPAIVEQGQNQGGFYIFRTPASY